MPQPYFRDRHLGLGRGQRGRARSLRVQLTSQVAILAALGLGSMTAWSAWQMRSLLLGSHQRTLDYVGDRFTHDFSVALAQGSGLDTAAVTAIQAAVQTASTKDILLWVENPQMELVASSVVASASAMQLQELRSHVDFSSKSHLVPMGEPSRYLVVCGVALENQQQTVGKLYLAYDVSSQHQAYITYLRHLIMASLLLLGLLTGAIAHCVRQVTQPLKAISDTASQLSATDLNPITLDQSPEEIAGLVEAFNAMLLRLSEAWEKQRQFINDASHELRTPLTVVDGYLQSILRRKDNLNLLQQEALGTAAEETQRTIHMVEEMLEIARADSGQLVFDLKPIVLHPLLQETLQTIQARHLRSLILRDPPGPIIVLADPKYLQQALVHLLENAIQYSEPSEAICISLTEQFDRISITVQDTGIGIDPKHLNHIFERFYRADPARHRQGGTGLGLAIAKAWVEGMGGTITVQSQVNQGSTFTISLQNYNFSRKS